MGEHGTPAPACATDTLHVYSAEHSHEPAYIWGTVDALQKLRDAIDRSLSSGRPEFAMTFAADGEGYALIVMPASDMTEAALHYADLRAEDGRWPVLDAEDWDRLRKTIRGGR
jgi:hypothetical protein